MKKIQIGDVQLLVREEDNKIGIEDLEKLAEYIVSVGKRGKKVTADGKVTWMEALGSLGYTKGFIELYMNISEIKAQLRDLTKSELQRIYDILDAGFELNDRVDAFVEEGLDLLELINKFSKAYA